MRGKIIEACGGYFLMTLDIIIPSLETPYYLAPTKHAEIIVVLLEPCKALQTAL